MTTHQVSRTRLAGRFLFNFAIAPLLLMFAIVAVCWLLGVVGIIPVNG